MHLRDLSEPVEVMMISGKTGCRLVRMNWRNRTWRIERVGLHHHYWKGKVLIHIFSVVAEGVFVRLRLESDSLRWIVEEVGDALG